MLTDDGVFGRALGRATAVLVAIMWVLTSIVVPPAARAADGQLTVTKSVDVTTVEPGQPVLYTIEVGCSAIQTSCISPVLTDELPVEFVVTTNSLPTDVPNVVDYEFTAPSPGPGGGTFTARYISPLPSPPAPPGSVGLLGGTTQQIKIPVQFSQTSTVPSGTDVTNTAVFEAENAPTVESSVTVTVNNPPTLLPVGDKNWIDGSAIAGTGEESTIELKVRNNSRIATVTELSMTDVDPDTFEYFDVRALGPVKSWPAGATDLRIQFCDQPITTGQTAATCTDAQLEDGGTYARSAGNGPFVPVGLDLSTLTGVKFTFLGSPLANEQTTLSQVDLGLVLRETIRSSLPPQAINEVGSRIDVVNTATPSLVATEGTKTGTPVSDTYSINPPVLKSVTSKEYCAAASGFECPDPAETAFAGQGSRVLVDVRATDDSGFSVSGMTITEPSPNDPNAAATFATIDTTTVRVEVPAGADPNGTVVTATCRVGSSVGPVTWTGEDLTAAQLCVGTGGLPSSVKVTFVGVGGDSTIENGATGRLIIAGTLNQLATARTWQNCASSSLSNPTNGTGSGASTDCAEFVISSSALLPNTEKTFESDSDLDFTPDGTAFEGQGSGVVIGVTGTNTNAFPVDGMSITDPEPGNPSAQAAFDSVDVTQIRITPPGGTATAKLLVTCRGSSVPAEVDLVATGAQTTDVASICASGVFPSSVTVDFTGTIAAGASGKLEMVGRLNGNAIAGTLENCAVTELTNAGSPNSPATDRDCATLTIETSEITSATTKTFCGGTDPSCPSDPPPPPVVAGAVPPSSVAMRVTGTNTSGFAVDTLTIVEPEPGNTEAELAFAAVDVSTVTITPPAGTTTTLVTPICRTGTPNPQTITGPAGTPVTLAPLCTGGLPSSIEVVFTGSIPPSASGVVDIVGTANENATAGNPLNNCAETVVTKPGSEDGISFDCASLTPVPNVVGGDVSKTFSSDTDLDFTPDGSIVEGQGGGVVMRISATNRSGFAISEIRITEPAPDNTAFAQLDTVERIRLTPPATTTTTTLTLDCDGTTTSYPYGADQVTVEVGPLCPEVPGGPTRVKRVQVTYEGIGTIANGSTAILEIAGTLDPTTPGPSLRNCAEVEGSAGVDVVGVVCGSLPILANELDVSGTKTFCPDADASFGCDTAGSAIAGQNSGVYLGVVGTNTTRFPVDTLTITDPDPASSAAVEFAKVDISAVRVSVPTGATLTTVSATCRVGVAVGPVIWAGTDIPASALCGAGGLPSSVRVVFTGRIPSGAVGELNMVGTLNDTATVGTLNNCALFEVTGPGADPVTDQACDNLPVIAPRIELEREKSASSGVIAPGQPLDYSLRVTNVSNIPVTGVEIVDPVNPTLLTEPFRFVRLVSVTTPASPANTIEVWDPLTSGYVDYNPDDAPLLARARGIRVTVTDPLAVGASFGFTYQVLLRDSFTPDPEDPNDLAFDNCAVASVEDYVSPEFCSGEILAVPGTYAASVNKTFNPSELPRPFPGDTTPAATTDLQSYVRNTGDLNLSKIVLTDTDADFWAAYQVADADAVRVNLPPGADRVQLDVCTSAANCASATFVNGTLTTATNPVPLPSGVTADQVWGLRVTYTRADGLYQLIPDTTEPPTGNNCVGNSLCVRIRPLATLRAEPPLDDPVLAPDVSENTLQTGIRSIRQDQGDPNDLFPVPDVSADLSLTEETASMDIDKDPNTRLSPGSIAPFTLVIENTGRAIIPDLLVTDPIPADLEFVQQAGLEPYTVTYALPDGAPAALPDQPVFATTTTPVGGIDKISEVSWSWPGWAFVPGARVTINFQVRLAAGVPANTVVPNTAEVTSRPGFKFICTPDNDDDGEQLVDGQKSCTSWAEITSLAGNSFDGTKWVAGDDDLGFKNSFPPNLTEPTDATTCPRLVVDGRAYTHFPCVALNNPGQPFSYLLQLTNSGNTADVTQIQLLDTLPVIGDKGVLLNTQQRGTEWDPRPRLLSGPSGQNAGTLTTEYTTDDTVGQDLCFDTWPSGIALPLPSECARADWTAPFDPAATAFRSLLDFGTDPLSPGETALVRFEVDSPLALTDPGSFAWNSFAFQIEFVPLNSPGAPLQYLAPTEPIQAGIGIQFGGLEVTKTVVNPPPGVVLDPFPIDYECTTEQVTSEGTETVVVTGGTVQVTAGETELISNTLPAGATCRVWETDSQGAASDQLGEADAVVVVITPGTNADGTPKPPQNVTITNTFEQGFLSLSKVLDGPGVQYVDAATPFVFDVTCTFLAQPLTGFNPRTVTLTPADPASDVLGPLPAGALCTVEEQAPYGGADGPAELSPPSPQDGYTITTGVTPLAITATNTFSVGPLVVNKTVDNIGVDLEPLADSLFPLVFQLEVTCEQALLDGTFTTLPGYPQIVELSFDKAELPGPPDPPVTKSVTVDEQLPVGARCWAVELDSQGATGVVVDFDTPENSVTVQPPGDGGEVAEISITATNTYEPGAISIRKVITGDGAQFAKEAFIFDVVCRNADGDVVEEFELTIKPPKRTAGRGGLPVNALCEVTEREPWGGADGPAVLDPEGPYLIVGGDALPVEVTATNTFSSGTLTIAKELAGPGQSVAATIEFTLQATCTAEVNGIDVEVLDEKVLLRGGQESDPLGPLPIGAECTVTEIRNGGATSTVIAPSPVVITLEEQDVTVTATNTYGVGDLLVRKVVTGPGAPFADRPFTFQATCTFQGLALPVRSVTITPPATTGVITGIPTGSACSVRETSAGGADGPAAVTPDNVIIGDGTVVEVTATNTFSVGSVVVTKTATGPGAVFLPTSARFTVQVTCERPAATGFTPLFIKAVEVAAGQRVVVSDAVPIGSRCWGVESANFGATTAAVIPGSAADAAIVTLAAPTITLTAINNYLTARIDVSKVVVGEGDGPYTFLVQCTWNASGTAVAVPLPGGGVLTLDDGDEGGFDVPAPSTCSVTETDVPEGAEVTVSESGDVGTGALTDGVVTLAAVGDVALVEVTNTFAPLEPDEDTTVEIADTGASLGYLPFGLLALVFGGLLVWVSRRRRLG